MCMDNQVYGNASCGAGRRPRPLRSFMQIAAVLIIMPAVSSCIPVVISGKPFRKYEATLLAEDPVVMFQLLNIRAKKGRQAILSIKYVDLNDVDRSITLNRITLVDMAGAELSETVLTASGGDPVNWTSSILHGSLEPDEELAAACLGVSSEYLNDQIVRSAKIRHSIDRSVFRWKRPIRCVVNLTIEGLDGREREIERCMVYRHVPVRRLVFLAPFTSGTAYFDKSVFIAGDGFCAP